MARRPCPLGEWKGEKGRCNWCDKALPVGGRRTAWCSKKCSRIWTVNHVWRYARIEARRRAKYRCSIPECTAERRDVEIDHMEPRNGVPINTVGCLHHQDPDKERNGGLRALCRAHHQEVTAQQATARAAKRRAAKAQMGAAA